MHKLFFIHVIVFVALSFISSNYVFGALVSKEFCHISKPKEICGTKYAGGESSCREKNRGNEKVCPGSVPVRVCEKIIKENCNRAHDFCYEMEEVCEYRTVQASSSEPTVTSSPKLTFSATIYRSDGTSQTFDAGTENKKVAVSTGGAVDLAKILAPLVESTLNVIVSSKTSLPCATVSLRGVFSFIPSAYAQVPCTDYMRKLDFIRSTIGPPNDSFYTQVITYKNTLLAWIEDIRVSKHYGDLPKLESYYRDTLPGGTRPDRDPKIQHAYSIVNQDVVNVGLSSVEVGKSNPPCVITNKTRMDIPRERVVYRLKTADTVIIFTSYTEGRKNLMTATISAQYNPLSGSNYDLSARIIMKGKEGENNAFRPLRELLLDTRFKTEIQIIDKGQKKPLVTISNPKDWLNKFMIPYVIEKPDRILEVGYKDKDNKSIYVQTERGDYTKEIVSVASTTKSIFVQIPSRGIQICSLGGGTLREKGGERGVIFSNISKGGSRTIAFQFVGCGDQKTSSVNMPLSKTATEQSSPKRCKNPEPTTVKVIPTTGQPSDPLTFDPQPGTLN